MKKTLEQSCIDIYMQKCAPLEGNFKISNQIHQYLVLNFYEPEKIVENENSETVLQIMNSMLPEELERFFDNYDKKHELETIKGHAELCAARRYKYDQTTEAEEFTRTMNKLKECIRGFEDADKYGAWLDNLQWEISTNMRFAIGGSDTILQSAVDAAELV